MASNDLRLQVVLSAIDRVSAPLKHIQKASSAAASALKDARKKVKELEEQQKAIGDFRKLQDSLKANADKLAAMRARLTELRSAHVADAEAAKAHARELKAGEAAATRLAAAHAGQLAKLGPLRQRLATLGVANVAKDEARLAAEMASTNRVIDAQQAKLKSLGEQQRRMDALRAQHGKTMRHTAMIGAGGAAAYGAGRALARPLSAVVGAFMPQEDAAAQLRSSLMRKDGSAPEELKKITELAARLGDRLPGTTADFQNMMTMLIRQGMSARTILGGLGESAAYLGVQLRMPVTEAAEFAAKMQDATRTAEGDMMGLMDVIQRTFYLGVDSGNMLQGFTKLSPVLSILRKEGLGAAQDLAPLLVMMDQTGMAGESAGNAIRKVFQAGLDAKKLGKANDALKGMKAGFKLDFTDGKGEFGGIDQLFAQIDKLKALDSVKRTSVVKTLFGDDAETLQVLNTLMAKGKEGYDEVIAKMQAQADLRKRVEAELQTLKNVAEAAEGSFTNALSDIGAAAAPQLKALLEWLGGLATKVGDFARENPKLTSTLLLAVGAIALLATAGGALALGLAAIAGPMLAMRFGMQLLGLKGFGLIGALKGVVRVIALIGRALLMNPIGLLITAIAVAALLIYTYWEPIKQFFSDLWAGIKQTVSETMDWFAALPGRFFAFGADMMQGLADGIRNALGSVKTAITGAGDAAIGWFKEKLGIRSPSRVFMLAGNEISNGAAEGISERQSRVRQVALGMAAAAAVALPMAAGAAGAGTEAGALQFDRRPPLAATAAQRPLSIGGDTIHITIQAAPGMDAQALARVVSAELDRRQRSKRASMMSSLSDID